MVTKYYAVKNGRVPGIYKSWSECERQTKGFKGALFKSFKTLEEAEKYMNGAKFEEVAHIGKSSPEVTEERANVPYAFVDGSYNAVTKVYGFGGFLVHNGEKDIVAGHGNDPELAEMRNVAGEIGGATEAVKMAIDKGLKSLVIYYDYLGIKAWADGEWKANKKGTKAYAQFMKEAREHIDIRFKKVKGHSGIEGNEEADRIAKKESGIN